MLNVIRPDWPAPSHVTAFTTTRIGGNSKAPYDSLNLAYHVNDDDNAVAANREQLGTQFRLPNPPCWLQQVHSTKVILAETYAQPPIADAVYTHEPGAVCAVLTADCLPLLLCDQQGTQVAAVHAGWRGLAGGIIASTLAQFKAPRTAILAWLGPAIGPAAYEVGKEVKAAFEALEPQSESAFKPAARPEHWYADLYELARLQLKKSGVNQIFGGKHCTFTEKELFYSYRRDGNASGRMASLIWLENKSQTSPLLYPD